MHELHSARCAMRIARDDDAEALLHYRLANRDHLQAWEPLREQSYFTLDHCRQTIVNANDLARLDRGYSFTIFADGRMIGSFNFAHVVRGAFQACHLGYAIAAAAQGRGLMREALLVGFDFAFGSLKLHRVMASYMPANERSARLLHSLGFEREGNARRYLCIAGRWEDHVLTALVRD